MINRKKEIAKFFCGVEAFHAFIHTYFWLSGKTVKAFGLRETPSIHQVGAVGNAIAAVALGIYGWRKEDANPTDALDEGEIAGNAG